MIPPTTTRVHENTDEAINERISRQTACNVSLFAGAGEGQINQRLRELDREWDVERTLETNAASIALLGLGLGTFVNRRFLILPAMVAGFLLQHAIQGWCPPIPILRRLGIRTTKEIDSERYALKVIRGDFAQLPAENNQLGSHEINRIVEAVNR